MSTVRVWDKIPALSAAIRHLGLFERDNIHRADNMTIKIEFVDPPAGGDAKAG